MQDLHLCMTGPFNQRWYRKRPEGHGHLLPGHWGSLHQGGFLSTLSHDTDGSLNTTVACFIKLLASRSKPWTTVTSEEPQLPKITTDGCVDILFWLHYNYITVHMWTRYDSSTGCVYRTTAINTNYQTHACALERCNKVTMLAAQSWWFPWGEGGWGGGGVGQVGHHWTLTS